MIARTIPGLLSILLFFVGSAHAQLPGVDQTVLGRGSTDYAEEVGGPADLSVGVITLEPGARYGGWHTHPGVVWVIVTRGELIFYGPDGCATTYPTGSAYRAAPDTLYDLRNESDAPLELVFSGIVRRGESSTLFVGDGGPTCGS